jgi:hypothetical protein
MLKGIVRLFAPKFLFVFIAAFLISVSVNALTGSYWFTFTVNETFLESETASLLKKKVVDRCFQSPFKNIGTIVSHGVNDYDGTRFVEIEWEKPIGKFKTTKQGKEVFELCSVLESE